MTLHAWESQPKLKIISERWPWSTTLNTIRLTYLKTIGVGPKSPAFFCTHRILVTSLASYIYLKKIGLCAQDVQPNSHKNGYHVERFQATLKNICQRIISIILIIRGEKKKQHSLKFPNDSNYRIPACFLLEVCLNNKNSPVEKHPSRTKMDKSRDAASQICNFSRRTSASLP